MRGILVFATVAAALAVSACGAPKVTIVTHLNSWVGQIKNSLQKMENQMKWVEEVNFIPPSAFDGRDPDVVAHSIYAPDGGGLAYRETLTGKQGRADAQLVFRFATGVEMPDVGDSVSDDTAGDELFLFVDQLDAKECERINTAAGVTPWDVKLKEGLRFIELGGPDLDTMVSVGERQYDTIKSVGRTENLTLGDEESVPGSGPLKGHEKGCFYDPDIHSYRFYAVLKGR